METSALHTNSTIFLIVVTPQPCVATPYRCGSSVPHWEKYNNQMKLVAMDGAMATQRQRQWTTQQQRGSNAMATQRQHNSHNDATAMTGGGSLAVAAAAAAAAAMVAVQQNNGSSSGVLATAAWRRRGGDGGGGGGTGSVACSWVVAAVARQRWQRRR